MNELIHLRQGEQKLRPIIKYKIYNRGFFEIYKTCSYLMRGVLLIIIVIILFSGPTCLRSHQLSHNRNLTEAFIILLFNRFTKLVYTC